MGDLFNAYAAGFCSAGVFISVLSGDKKRTAINVALVALNIGFALT